MLRRRTLSPLLAVAHALLATVAVCAQSPTPPPSSPWRSHPPMHAVPGPGDRAMPAGPTLFVDGAKGSDAGDGSEKAPFKTIRTGLEKLRPGDTLCLRAGTYYEPVYVALRGTAEKPITIRACRGETVVIDGGLPEFFRDPSRAWEPVPASEGGVEGEYRSVRAFPNARDVIGAFGDSMVGLQTYWHLTDLRANNENFTTVGKRDPNKDPRQEDKDTDPIYVGPGVFYDAVSGRIHACLAPTHLPGIDNYRGEADPRKLPLVLATFRAVPFHLDQGEHVKFQDLVIRGGGYDTVVVDKCNHVDFDNVTIHAGTYGMMVRNTSRLRFWRSGIYGNLAGPWTFRAENGLRARPGRTTRDIARLTGHALWVIDTGREYSVYAFPMNDDWEIAYSEFTDSHDGPYLGGVNLRFHHNLVDNMQDDGIYLSPMYPRYDKGATLQVHDNVFSRCLSTLAFGGPEDSLDTVYVYRNVFDLRGLVKYNRPLVGQEPPKPFLGRPLGTHGKAGWPTFMVYHNTFVMADPSDPYMGWMGSVTPEHPRQLRNNLFLHLAAPAGGRKAIPEAQDGADSGNLVWTPAKGSPQADLKLCRVEADAAKANDYSPQPGSPAINTGVVIPKDWPGAADPRDEGAPDIGALPAGAPMPRVGRSAAPP